MITAAQAGFWREKKFCPFFFSHCSKDRCFIGGKVLWGLKYRGKFLWTLSSKIWLAFKLSANIWFWRLRLRKSKSFKDKMGPNFMDETDCGSFFDQVDDLIQFPPENECAAGGSSDLVSSDDCKDFPSMWNDALPQCGPLFSGNHGNNVSDLSAELSVPYEDIVQMEWLSTFVEDSFSGGGMTLIKENLCAKKEPSPSQSQTSSPVSVLERSSGGGGSSCCGKKTTPLGPTQRARSKRPRPASFNPRTGIQLISSPPSSVEPHQPFLAPGFSSESENFADLKKIPKPSGAQPKKKKKIKVTSAVDPEEDHQNPPVQVVRKCLHCEITKTPQWRAGPMGPKTLCNACGVRYKSGRLFPEYRPAASPTFVQSMHSSSHKKVLEMRNKALPGITATTLDYRKVLS